MRRYLVSAALIVLFESSAVRADSFGLFSDAYTSLWAGDLITGQTLDLLTCSTSGGSSSSCSVSKDATYDTDPNSPYPGRLLTGVVLKADSAANFGLLRVSESVRFGFGGPSDFYPWSDVSADASFVDELTISGGSGTGYVQYSMVGYAIREMNFAPYFRVTQDSFLIGVEDLLVTGNFNYTTLQYPFTWGQPFTLSVTASLNDDLPGESGSGLLTVDHYGVSVFDSAGHPVTDYTLTSLSGSSYPIIPEPSTLALLGIGLGGLIGYRRKARH